MRRNAVWKLLTGKERAKALRLVALVLVGALLDAVGLAAVYPLVSVLFQQDSVIGLGSVWPDTLRHFPVHNLRVLFLAIFASFYIVKNIFLIWLSFYKFSVIFDLQARISEDLLEAYISNTNLQIASMSSGNKISLAQVESQQLIINTIIPLLNIISETGVIAFIFLSLVLIKPIETIGAVAFFGMLIFVFEKLTRAQVQGWGTKRKDADKRRAELIKSTIDSRVEIVGLGLTDRLVKQYRVANMMSASHTARKAFITEIPRNLLEVALVLAFLLLMISSTVTSQVDRFATMAVLAAAAFRLLPSMNRLLVSFQSLKFGVSTLSTLNALFDGYDRIVRQPMLPEKVFPPFTTLVYSANQIKRPGSSEIILASFTFEFYRGDIVAVVGGSGQGKSLFAAAMIDSSLDGRLAMDGRSVSSADLAATGYFGYVSQNPLILWGTVRENMLLDETRGDEPSELAIPVFLKDCSPDQLLGGADTEIQKRVIDRSMISGGQAQRISLIRSLIRRPQVLILDEATSALNEQLRDGLFDWLYETRQERVAIVATHDRELLRYCNRVIEIAHGAATEIKQ